MNIASYLVAFIVSDFKGSEKAVNFNGEKSFKTWGQARYLDNNEDELSQQAGPAVLDIMKNLTGVEFAYPKVDQVGIPDFSAGAMENWGLTTYRYVFRRCCIAFNTGFKLCLDERILNFHFQPFALHNIL